jgi:hypothetical protein
MKVNPDYRRKLGHRSAAIVSAAAVAFATLLLQALVVVTPVLAVTTCPTDGTHWYGAATSGTGTTTGTEIRTNMPASYYAPAGTGTDEAAWLINIPRVEAHDTDSAVEIGWFQGRWPYTTADYGDFFTYPQGYYTLDGGGNPAKGWVLTGRLPASTQLQFQVNSSGGGVDIGTSSNPTEYAGFDQDYPIPTSRTNYSQGEVAGSVGAWMGGNGGSGTTSYGYFQPSSGGWNSWSGFTTCENSPYWINTLSGNSWKYGGA